MGRSIGGGGGGHSSSSHSFGGGRSSGGSHSFGGSSFRSSSHSSSHRSIGGSSFSSGRSYSNYRPSSRGSRRPYGYYGGPAYYGGSRRRGGSSAGCGGCLTSVALFFIIFILIASFGGTKGNGKSYNSKQGLGRTKYTGPVDSSKGYYLDESKPYQGEVYIDKGNERYLISGFSEFYNDTGVYPFIYVVDDYPAKSEYEGFNNYEEKVYDDLFGDCGGNLLFVYVGNEQAFYTAAGNATGEIVDAESFEVIESNILSRWSEDDLAKTFGYGLSAAGNRIMAESKAQTVMKSNKHKVSITLIVVAGGIVVVLIGKNWWEKKKKIQKEDDERLEKILKEPLKKFDDGTLEGLSTKYDKAPAASSDKSDDKGITL